MDPWKIVSGLFFFALWNSSFNPLPHLNQLKKCCISILPRLRNKNWIIPSVYCKHENINVLQPYCMTSETRLFVLPTTIQIDKICSGHQWRDQRVVTMKHQQNLIAQRHLPDMLKAATSTANKIAVCHCVQIHDINVSHQLNCQRIDWRKPFQALKFQPHNCRNQLMGWTNAKSEGVKQNPKHVRQNLLTFLTIILAFVTGSHCFWQVTHSFKNNKTTI